MFHNNEEPEFNHQDLWGEKSNAVKVIVVWNKEARSKRIPGAYWQVSLYKLGSLESGERLYLRR